VRRATKLYLGLSLTTTILRKGVRGGLVFDIWPGGSTLYGWDVLKQCVDRVPICVNDPNTVNALGGVPVKLELEEELLGTESDYELKVTCGGHVSIQRDWIAGLTGRRWYASGGWCSLFRKLIKQERITAGAIFGDLRFIDVERKTAYVLPHGLITYEGIVNSLPLEYVVGKVTQFNARRQFRAKYVTLYITTVITKGGHEPHVWFLGKRRFTSSAVVSLPFKLLYPQLGLSSDNLTLIYAFTPQLMGRLSPDAHQKVMADLRRLGFDVRDAMFIRSHFERYGYLGQREGVEDVINLLRDYEVECVGRLGTWRELGVNEVLREYSSLRQ